MATEREALEHAIREQRDSRNLTPSEFQRLAVAAIARLDARKARGGTGANQHRATPSREGIAPGESAEKTAVLVGVSRATVERVRTVLDHGDVETRAALPDVEPVTEVEQ